MAKRWWAGLILKINTVSPTLEEVEPNSSFFDDQQREVLTRFLQNGFRLESGTLLCHDRCRERRSRGRRTFPEKPERTNMPRSNYSLYLSGESTTHLCFSFKNFSLTHHHHDWVFWDKDIRLGQWSASWSLLDCRTSGTTMMISVAMADWNDVSYNCGSTTSRPNVANGVG